MILRVRPRSRWRSSSGAVTRASTACHASGSFTTASVRPHKVSNNAAASARSIITDTTISLDDSTYAKAVLATCTAAPIDVSRSARSLMISVSLSTPLGCGGESAWRAAGCGKARRSARETISRPRWIVARCGLFSLLSLFSHRVHGAGMGRCPPAPPGDTPVPTAARPPRPGGETRHACG